MAGNLPDIQTLLQAGIDPRTKLPTKMVGNKPTKVDIKAALRILDEQNALTRYNWYNLPASIDSELLERILYYRGQGAFFFMKSAGEFLFLPYALDGSIDVYGRFLGITPLPFNGSTKTGSKEVPWIIGLIKKPIYNIPLELTQEMFEDGCVLLCDYNKQISQINLPRQIIQEPILDLMSETLPMARTALIANSGIKGVRVQDEGQAETVRQAAIETHEAALTGTPWIPIVGTTDFQDLTNSGSTANSEQYLEFMQALDNFRLSLYGLDSGGLFQKKSQMLEAEQSMNANRAKSAYQDGLSQRQKFCDIVNSIWGLGIWCEPSEAAMAMDKNGDGAYVDEIDQSGLAQGDQPVQPVAPEGETNE